MIVDDSRLSKIAESVRNAVREFAQSVPTWIGAHAKAMSVFGGALSRGFDPRRQSVHSVLVMDRVDLHALRRLAVQGPNFGREGIAAPLIMTPEYIQGSRDTFSLELIEIQQNHVTLFGEDHFSALTFDPQHVRLQCERELKIALLTMRQSLLADAGAGNGLVGVQTEVAENLIRTLRGLLWLKGRREALPAPEVVAAVEQVTNSDLLGLRSALRVEAAHGPEGFDALYGDVEVLKRIVDAW